MPGGDEALMELWGGEQHGVTNSYCLETVRMNLGDLVRAVE